MLVFLDLHCPQTVPQTICGAHGDHITVCCKLTIVLPQNILLQTGMFHGVMLM